MMIGKNIFARICKEAINPKPKCVLEKLKNLTMLVQSKKERVLNQH